MSWLPVTKASSLSLDSAREFTVESNHRAVELFIIHINEQFFAYMNHCPHTGVNLNWQPDQFFDIDHQFIQCSTHGALFRFEDGLCVRGPCAGASLTSVPLKIENDTLYVQI